MTVRVLAIPGSLRRASYNRALLEAACELAPEGVELEVADLRDIPLYDEDVEAEGDPAPVCAFKDAIRDADALLIATPEYNTSLPGVLKNAIDWASRPAFMSPLAGKPVALAGASTGRSGARRALEDARRVLGYTRSEVLPDVHVSVPRAADRFDDEGRLVDEDVRRDLRELLEQLRTWVEQSRANVDLVAIPEPVAVDTPSSVASRTFFSSPAA